MKSPWLTLGAIFGGLAVAMGAFAAHALKEQWAGAPERLNWVETGAKYEMYHSLALIGIGLLAGHASRWATNIAGAGFTLGIILFSGSLYLLAFTETRWLGMITPIGGVSILIGWAGFAIAGWQASRSGAAAA